MHSTDVFGQILFSCETRTRATFAVCERTEERFLGATMHLVHLALVTQESTAVREALELLASFDGALVRAVVLVHVLAVQYG